MVKTELIKAYAKKIGVSREKAAEGLNALQDLIVETLETGEEVVLMELGLFEVRDYAAKTTKNPRTGEEMNIPARKKVAFKNRKLLNDLLK